MKKEKMTLEEHMQMADDLAMATHYLKKIYDKLIIHNQKTSILIRNIYKINPSLLGGVISNIKSELDNQYHSLVSNEEFHNIGHIYYNLEDRYNKIMEKKNNNNS